MPKKISMFLNRGREESVGNGDVSIVCTRKYEMVRMTSRQKIPKGPPRSQGSLRSFVWINELLILRLTLTNVYTRRLARLISPVGSLWIYCKRFLRFLSDPDRLCCSPFWKSKTVSHILAGARQVARRATEARSANLASPQSLGLRYIECVTTKL